jgi:Fic family protein
MMEKSKFRETSPGRLVQIDRADHPTGKDWAFIPDPLPAAGQFVAPLIDLIVRATDRLGNLNGHAATLDDYQLLLRPLQSREAISSSRIEGTFVSPEQLLLFEMNPREPKSKTDPTADLVEVHNYRAALDAGASMSAESPLGCHVIRSMHSILMQGVRGEGKSPGAFRTRQVQIGSNARFIPPPPVEVGPLMRNLEDDIASETDASQALIKCFLVHYQFEAIHPFEDGNGRVGRALLSLMVYKLLRLDHPWLYLSAYFERFQDEYIARMFRVSTSGDWIPWLEFCLNGVISQANDSIARCTRFRKLKEEFHQRVVNFSPTIRTHTLIEQLFRDPIVEIRSLKERFQVHYQTAKRDLELLVAAGVLAPLDETSVKTYYAPEIMEIAFSRAEMD